MSHAPEWNDHRAFLAVLESGSLSAAARQLGLSQPTVRARIAALEAALGTVLFTRSVHKLVPTPSALAISAPVRAMAHAAEAVGRAASGDGKRPAGRVRLSVSEFIGVEVLPAMLRRLHDSHPNLIVEYELSNAAADLPEQQVDVAVRMHQPRQAALVAKKVPAIPLGLFAHRDYVARHGHPRTRADIADHRFIGPDRSAFDMAVANHIGGGQTLQWSARTDSHAAYLALARAGLGIAVVQIPAAARYSELVRVCEEIALPPLETWIVAHEELRRLPRVAALFDHLVAEFGEYGAAGG